MPVHDGPRSDQDERLSPPGPERSQRNPRTACAGAVQSTARVVACAEPAIADGQPGFFEDEVLPGNGKALTNQPRKCRSDTIMARILAEKIRIQFLRQVIHSAGVRRFVGEAHPPTFELFLC